MPESSSPTSTAAPGADVRDPPDREADRYRVILDSVVEAIVVFDPVTLCHRRGQPGHLRAPREDPRRADRPALRIRPQAGRGSARAGDHRPVGLGRTRGVDGHARLPAGSRSAGGGRGRPAGGRPAGQFARHRRDRSGRPRADRGPGPPPAPGPGRARPRRRAQRGHPGDGRGRRRVRRRRHDHADEPGRRAPLPRRRGAHVRRDPRAAQRRGRQRAATRRARRAGRDPDPGRSRSLDRARRRIRSTSASEARRAAARRSSSCAT